MKLTAITRALVRPQNSRADLVRTISSHGNTNIPISITDIYLARSRIQPHVHRTPLFTSSTFDHLYKRKFFFKGEHLQNTGSFKIRGALNAVLSLQNRNSKAAGVVTHSSGNHGQALAWAAQICNVKCHVILPDSTPEVKVRSIIGYGAEITYSGSDPNCREEACQRIVNELGYVSIPTSDHYDIIAGQGTVGLELVEDIPILDAVLVSASRGGLAAGVALAVKSLNANIKIFVVEPYGKNLGLCLQRGERVLQPHPLLVDTIADGIRTLQLGQLTWPIIQYLVEEKVLTVNNDDIIKGMRFAFERMKLVVEGAAGAVVAAAMSEEFRKVDDSIRNVGVILCGGNVDIDELPWIKNHKM